MNTKISQLPVGGQALSTDLSAVSRAGANVSVSASSIASLATQITTQGSLAPASYTNTGPASGLIPFIFQQDNNGNSFSLAGIDTTTPSPSDGTFTITRRTFIRDNQSDQQGGKNAMFSLNHQHGVGTLPTIQDRAIWVGANNVTAAISSFSITSNIITLNLSSVDGFARFVGFHKDQTVIPTGLSVGTYLNSQVLTVLTATRPSIASLGTQTITCSWTSSHADVGTTNDSGTLDQKMYSMVGYQSEVDIVGTPTFYPGTDTEIKTLSLQLGDYHVGNANAPGGGVGVIRAQYFREAGAGSWSAPQSVITGLYTNVSTVTGNSQTVDIFSSRPNDATGTAARMAVVGFHANVPTNRFNNNWGFYCDNFGTNANDRNIFSAGVMSTSAGVNEFQGPVLLGTRTPSSASDAGITGTVTWDSGFVYVCTATNTWKRAAIATW